MRPSRREFGLAFITLCIGLALGFLTALAYLTGFDEVSEQIAAFHYMRVQSRYWDKGPPDAGPKWPNWQASVDMAIPEGTPPITEAELRGSLQQWELLERCVANGVSGPQSGHGEVASQVA
jgi:hypothetical protein